jgi:NADH-quinone oxidoreductase subunit L
VSVSTSTQWVLALVAIAGATFGILAAAAVYLRHRVEARRVEPDILARGWGYDDAVSAFMGGPGRRLFALTAWFDRTFVDGAVNGVAKGTTLVGTRMRLTQTGLVRTYALGVVIGTVALATYFVARITF